MRKQIQYIIFFTIIISLIFIFSNNTLASYTLKGIENFPASYKPYLYELNKHYPNWEFTALYTEIDFNYAVSTQYKNGRALVPKNYSDSWKCLDTGIYNVEIDAGWVNASETAIKYVMDPRNFLNEVRMFKFEKLSYDTNTNTKLGVEKILYGTEFYNRTVSYKNAEGSTINMQEKYSDLIWDAAIYSGVSPYHLASRIKQEVGPFVTHLSISGNVSGYERLYNFYNIGATSDSDHLQVIKNGLEYAKNGKGASDTVKQNQLIPWNTPARAITGGGVFIGSKYINVGQNNLYLQKFAVDNNYPENIFWHQYMTNILAPYNEAKSIHTAYNSNDMLNSSIGFVIPVFNNMPKYMYENPNIIQSDYTEDNKKVYADVTNTLNLRNGPGTSYEVVANIPRNTQMTRIKKGVGAGERWDKVELSNGLVRICISNLYKRRANYNPRRGRYNSSRRTD